MYYEVEKEPSADKRLFTWYKESLYRGKKYGDKPCKYFIFGQGNAKSKYAKMIGQNMWDYGETITPITEEAARLWAEEALDADLDEKCRVLIAKGHTEPLSDEECEDFEISKTLKNRIFKRTQAILKYPDSELQRIAKMIIEDVDLEYIDVITFKWSQPKYSDMADSQVEEIIDYVEGHKAFTE